MDIQQNNEYCDQHDFDYNYNNYENYQEIIPESDVCQQKSKNLQDKLLPQARKGK